MTSPSGWGDRSCVMSDRSDQIAAYFAEHASGLQRAVGVNVTASEATVEDACAFAWTQLVRRADVDLSDERGVGWLYRVATREAWRLTSIERGAVSYSATIDDPDHWGLGASEPASPQDVEATVGARTRLDAVRALPERERRIVLLQAFGFTHAEIARRTGDTVRTVERQLRRAKQRLRSGDVEDLPPSERELLRELAAGASIRGAAATLGLSPQTAEEYAQSACRRLGVSRTSAVEAVRFA